MKAAAWIVLALLTGLVLGALGPRAELRRARQEVKDLDILLKSRSQARSTALADVTGMLRLSESVARGRSAAASNAAPVAAASPATPSAASNVVAQAKPPHDRARERRDLREQIDKAAEVWRVRSDVARSAFLANAGLDAEQAANFDVVMEAMNVRLKERITFWADRFRDGSELSQETGMRMMNDLSGVLVLTYDEMDRKLPPTWRTTGGAQMEMTDFVDPAVAEPLIGLEDRLPRRRHGGPGGPPFREEL